MVTFHTAVVLLSLWRVSCQQDTATLSDLAVHSAAVTNSFPARPLTPSIKFAQFFNQIFRLYFGSIVQFLILHSILYVGVYSI